MFRLNEKIDYTRDPEGPISIGMKILKRLDKDGWKGGDVYYAIEDIIVDADVKYPKQLAMRLERVLTNYDMWEAPYKGLVNKIRKWQYVNESADDNAYYDDYYDPRNAKRCKFEFFIKPHRESKVYDKVLNGDFANVKLEYEDDNYLEVSVPHFEYNAMIRIGNELLDRNLIEDFSLVESVKTTKRYSPTNEAVRKFRKAKHVDEVAPVVAAVVGQVATQAATQVAGQVANQVADKVSQQVTNVTDSDHEFGLSRRFNKRKRANRRASEYNSVKANKSSKLHEKYDNWDADDDYYYEREKANNKEIDYHSLAFNAIRYLNAITGEWSIYDIKSQLNNGKIDYDTIIDVMGRKMNADINDYEYEIIAQAINDEMARYYNDNKYMINEAEFNNHGPIDDFDRAYAAIDKLIYKSKEWTLDDVRNQLDNGDIWFQDVMNEMGIDMNNLSDEEDEELCNTIINAMQNYLDDKDYFGQLHENSYQSDFADKFAYDKYYRPRDIQELMQKSKQRGVQLSRFEHWVLEAALWARSRNNNYHGYSKEIPAVQYKNGKFYAQTIHDGMTEVPYNYDVMTPEWLFKK